MYKVILILDKFFLKYVGGGGEGVKLTLPTPRKSYPQKAQPCRVKKYHDYDDAEYKRYKGIRDVGNLFNQSTDEDYYESRKTNSAFNGDYIKCESNGGKDKNLSLTRYLSMSIFK